MRRAIAVAEGGLGLAAPNPLVGAVVVSDGRVAGEGWHEGPGTPHAEVVALGVAGPRARGATLYLTLEPCSHRGRTGPCAPAVADAGIARVVAAVRDPFPDVDGRGFAMLRERGVVVEQGVLAEEAGELIRGFATSRRATDHARRAWERAGAAVVVAGDQSVRIRDVLAHLAGEHQVQEVLVEGGSTLAWSAVEEGVVDRVIVYLAPK